MAGAVARCDENETSETEGGVAGISRGSVIRHIHSSRKNVYVCITSVSVSVAKLFVYLAFFVNEAIHNVCFCDAARSALFVEPSVVLGGELDVQAELFLQAGLHTVATCEGGAGGHGVPSLGVLGGDLSFCDGVLDAESNGLAGYTKNGCDFGPLHIAITGVESFTSLNQFGRRDQARSGQGRGAAEFSLPRLGRLCSLPAVSLGQTETKFIECRITYLSNAASAYF